MMRLSHSRQMKAQVIDLLGLFSCQLLFTLPDPCSAIFRIAAIAIATVGLLESMPASVVDSFDVRDVEGRPVTIDLSAAYFWAIAAVNALD